MAGILQGVNGPNRTTDTLIYRILATGDEWSQETRLDTEVSIPKSLRNVTGTPPWQDSVSAPRIGTNDLGSVTFDERVLSTNPFMIFEKFNANDWIDDFEIFRSEGQLIDLELNPDIASAIMDTLQNRSEFQESANIARGDTTVLTSGTLIVGETYEIVLYVAGDDFTNVGGTNVTGNIFTATATTPTTWTNSSQIRLAYNHFIDGLTTLIEADSDVITVAAAGAITSSNVFTILDDMLDSIPAEIRRTPGLQFIMSYDDYNILQQANRATQTNSTALGTGEESKLYREIPIVWKNSMPKDKIICTITGTGESSNLVRGVWFDSDKENFIMYKEQPADEEYAIALRARLGIQYRWGGHIVYYKPS